ncbi:MAG: hypothetical protein SLRJCFUN_001278, partial [Candidatus Fervidibacter sp.]
FRAARSAGQKSGCKNDGHGWGDEARRSRGAGLDARRSLDTPLKGALESRPKQDFGGSGYYCDEGGEIQPQAAKSLAYLKKVLQEVEA